MSEQGTVAKEIPSGEVFVRGSAKGFAQDITVRRHRLSGDEPTEDGGTDTGPSPRLLDIANKCPVHRTLTSEIVIETRIVPGGSE